MGSNIAKSELRHLIDFDTNCFLEKFYEDNPGVNEIYIIIRSLKTTYSSLPDGMVREDIKFKGNKDVASSFNNFLTQFVNDETQEVCDFTEATYNSLEFNVNKVSETLSNRSRGTGPDQVPFNVVRAVSNNLSLHFLELVQHIISTSDTRNSGS